jgi:hypothetical protein
MVVGPVGGRGHALLCRQQQRVNHAHNLVHVAAHAGRVAAAAAGMLMSVAAHTLVLTWQQAEGTC